MPKEIDESKLNYNKYPGEHVIASGDVVSVGDKTFHVVRNYREAFDTEKLEQRFSDVLDKYDYIVGDWGFEQLRLKGFFSASRKKMEADNKIDHLEDYINEYCNYGCAYFVLRRIRTRDAKRTEAFTSEKIFTEKEIKQKLDKPRRRRNRNKNRERDEQISEKISRVENRIEKPEERRKDFKMREKSTDRVAKFADRNPKVTDRTVRQQKSGKSHTDSKFTVNHRTKPKVKSEVKSKGQVGQGFVIRTRGKKD
ncbi:MAG: YutD family protein [Streptococcaceae bacterium]|nr:YutD family protein [Streptococcaceae bacterium]